MMYVSNIACFLDEYMKVMKLLFVVCSFLTSGFCLFSPGFAVMKLRS